MNTTEEALYAYELVRDWKEVSIYEIDGYEFSTVRRTDYSNHFAYWDEEIGEVIIGVHNFEGYTDENSDRFEISNKFSYKLNSEVKELLIKQNKIKNKVLYDYNINQI